jgi:hypothetical protein
MSWRVRRSSASVTLHSRPRNVRRLIRIDGDNSGAHDFLQTHDL